MTIGAQLGLLAQGKCQSPMQLKNLIELHRERVLLSYCFCAAHSGKKELNIGKSLPPCLDEEEIHFRKNMDETFTAYWAK